MSTQEAIWALESSSELTESDRADAIAQLKASEWSSIGVPITVGTITITGVSAVGQVVEFAGEGGTIDWPLRLVNAPISVPDPDGPDIDPAGNRSRVDCAAVLSALLGRFQ